MSPGLSGFLLIVLVGGAIMMLAALADRRSRQRIESITRPPKAIVSDKEHPKPTYVTADELQTQAGLLENLSVEDERSLTQQASTVFALSLMAPVLATHTPDRSILRSARVVVCDEAISTVREIIPILRKAAGQTALVLAAPGFDDGTEQTVIANHLAHKLNIQALLGTPEELRRFATETEATVISRIELQADQVTIDKLGFAETIVATPNETRLYFPDSN